MLNLGARAKVSPSAVTHAERGPVPPLVFLIGSEANLLGSPVGIDLVDFPVAVASAMDEHHKQATGLGAQHILQNADLEIVLEFVTRGVHGILKKSRVTATGGRTARFPNLIISGIGK